MLTFPIQNDFRDQIKEQAKHVVEEEAKLLAPLEQVRFLDSLTFFFFKFNSIFIKLIAYTFL